MDRPLHKPSDAGLPHDRTAFWGWVVLAIFTLILAEEATGYGIAFISLAVVTVSYVLVVRTTSPFRFHRITITSFWYLTYFAMMFFPALFVFANQETSSRARYLFAVESTLITVPLGWWLASAWYGFRREHTEQYFRKACVPIQAARVRNLYLGLLGVASLLTLLYVRQVETIPLLYLLKNPGDYLQLTMLREDSLKLLHSPFMYFFYLARSVLYPVLILTSLGCYLSTRQRLWFLLFALTATAGLLFASFSLAKSPVAMICALVGFFVYYLRRGNLPAKVIAIFLIVTLIFPFVVILGISEGTDVGFVEVSQGIAGRLFYIPAETSYFYFEVFPEQVHYLYGRSINKLSWLFGLEYFDTSNYVGQYEYPGAQESISANAAFISDLNADFGLWGVIFGGVFTGFLMQAFHIYVFRRPKTVFTLACYSFLVPTFWLLNSTSLPIVLLSNGAIFAVGLALLFERVSRGPRRAVEQFA
jgi:hypothetical protein